MVSVILLPILAILASVVSRFNPLYPVNAFPKSLAVMKHHAAHQYKPRRGEAPSARGRISRDHSVGPALARIGRAMRTRADASLLLFSAVEPVSCIVLRLVKDPPRRSALSSTICCDT
jgi:hypothetical protein